MSNRWNLTPDQWSNVLDSRTDASAAAKRIIKNEYLAWNEVLQLYTQDSTTVLDLGSGKGENAAMLALRGKQMTLLDWSEENLKFSRKLFEAIDQTAEFIQADMTKPLPFADQSFDTIFSCGIFEYFEDDQIKIILKEAFRVAKKRVIIMVPNAYSFPYRLGMWYMKKTDQWQWGGEEPFKSLKSHFKVMEGIKITEFSVATKHAFTFLNALPKGDLIRRLLTKILNLKDHSRPSLFNQGYLLITIGERIQ